MRYEEFSQEGPQALFAILARDLERAQPWMERAGLTEDSVSRGWILAVEFVSTRDADRFAHGAFGRARWRSADRKVVYLANRRMEIDLATEFSFAQRHLDQLRLRDRGRPTDGFIIGCAFPIPKLASAFAEALNAAELSGAFWYSDGAQLVSDEEEVRRE